MTEALEKEFPDWNVRILRLLEWFGSGEGLWSRYPSYEQAAENLLLTYATSELLAALAGRELTPGQTEGAARLFALSDFSRDRPQDNSLLPPELKRRLLEHCLKSTEKEKRSRAAYAFRTSAPGTRAP